VIESIYLRKAGMERVLVQNFRDIETAYNSLADAVSEIETPTTEYIEGLISDIISDYYTKSETNTLLADKADEDHKHPAGDIYTDTDEFSNLTSDATNVQKALVEVDNFMSTNNVDDAMVFAIMGL